MKITKKSIAVLMVLAVILALLAVAAFTTNSETVMNSFWALMPPIFAITLALVTKEVYSSLFVGILSGALLYSGFQFEGTVNHVFVDGIASVLSNSWNVGILVFLVILGAIVSLMNKAGGSAAFGRWAGSHIHSRVGAQLATIVLGIFIFIDDYFNCLTVGSVMKPVTDKNNISRAKLAYLIDSTAAPVCIIAPISSWAAAVAGFLKEDDDGLALFVQSIPFNFYALLTIVMMLGLVFLKVDFGPMALHERNAQKGDLFTVPHPVSAEIQESETAKGKVMDLLIPILSLIVCCVIGMLYTGGFFSGTGFQEAFANCDASTGLMFGSFFGLVITILLYLARRVMSFRDIMGCLPEGFKAMVPAILILTLAWSLKAMTDSLGASTFVATLVKENAQGLMALLPAIIFLIATGLAFATGTSWGTFGILIPIVIDALRALDPQLMLIAIAACMAGAVCGDHCSPISDTTIMASAGAQCDHVAHVSTQMPYALACAGISFVAYLVAGFTKSPWISLPIGILLMVGLLVLLKFLQKKKA